MVELDINTITNLPPTDSNYFFGIQAIVIVVIIIIIIIINKFKNRSLNFAPYLFKRVRGFYKRKYQFHALSTSYT